jgi:acid phosphatase type 7
MGIILRRIKPEQIKEAFLSTTPHKQFLLWRMASLTIAFLLIHQTIFALSPEPDFRPKRVILNLTENPAAGQSVTWRTTSRLKNPEAQIGIAQENVDVVDDKVTLRAAVDTVLHDDRSLIFYYSVSFENLQANTTYAYRVGSDAYWSEWNQFKTADTTDAAFSFVYFGDPQNDVRTKCSRIFRAAYQKAPHARFWHFTGDIVNKGNSDNEWEEFYEALGWIPRSTPMILVPGNHGYPKQIFLDKSLNKFWRSQFTLPENGPDGLEETAYFIDYQCARIFMLNTSEKLEAQAEWLDSLLNQTTQEWTVVSMHKPIYSTGRKRDNPSLRELLLPVFDKHHVDLVLQGHDHAYGRTFKCMGGKKVDEDKKGTVYVVSVSGSKVYSINARHETLMAKMGNDRQLFQVIHLSKNELSYTAYNVLGEIYDSFKLTK